MRKIVFAALMSLLLAACESIFGDDEEILPGERIPVMLLDRALEPDPRIADLPVRLPPPLTNTDWPQAGGNPTHAMHHLAAGEELRQAWRASIGEGSSDDQRLLAAPVIGDGRIFAMDADAEVSAFSTETGARIWRVETVPEDEEEGELGGGLAYHNGWLFVTTGSAQVIALDAGTGDESWRQGVPGPVRAAPTVSDGRVFAVTVDNQLQTLDAEDGAILWSHAGIAEIAGLLGGASPAVDGGIVIVPYSSGELFALRAENGRFVWSDTLAAIRRVDAVSALADIRGHPVMDRGRVFAVSHSGRMVAIDLRTGVRAWEQRIGGTQTPWVAGDFLYVLTTEGQLVCLSWSDGRIRWVLPLQRFEDEEEQEDPIIWTGPVLAGDRLIVAGSHSEVLSISPYTGTIMGWLKTSEAVLIPPVVAGNTIYLLTEDADLIALR